MKEGQIILYSNGNLGQYSAKIIKVEGDRLLVQDTNSVLNTQNYIFPSQVIE